MEKSYTRIELKKKISKVHVMFVSINFSRQPYYARGEIRFVVLYKIEFFKETLQICSQQ